MKIAYDDKGHIVGKCPDKSVKQVDLWKNDSYTIVDGPDIDITGYKYIDGKMTKLTDEIISKDETLMEKKKSAYIAYQKQAMRDALAGAIGDYGDNIADVTRALVLSEYIRSGVADKEIVDGYRSYCSAMVEMYGGAQAILDVLNEDLQGLQKYLAPYYDIKDSAIKANNAEAVTIEAKK